MSKFFQPGRVIRLSERSGRLLTAKYRGGIVGGAGHNREDGLIMRLDADGNPTKANPPRGGDAKPWTCQGAGRQAAEGDTSASSIKKPDMQPTNPTIDTHRRSAIER